MSKGERERRKGHLLCSSFREGMEVRVLWSTLPPCSSLFPLPLGPRSRVDGWYASSAFVTDSSGAVKSVQLSAMTKTSRNADIAEVEVQPACACALCLFVCNVRVPVPVSLPVYVSVSVSVCMFGVCVCVVNW